MHFENLIPESSTSNDYNRLVELCGSYGLNEEQTNQIISDFKNGSFAQPDQSIDQSFQDSIRNLQYPNHYCDRNSIEEYSFKDKQKLNFRQMVYEKDSIDYEHESEHKNMKSKSLVINNEILESFFNERREFEQNVYHKLQEQNDFLKAKLQQNQQRMEMLIKIKTQDSQIISGLKNSIVSIANSLEQKDRAYRTLLQKFECLKLENESLSTQKSSKIQQLSHQQSVNSIEERKSIQKQFCLTEIDQNRGSLLGKKQSQKQFKDLNKKNSSSKSIQDENIRASFIKNEPPKRNAVDINKYKGMIEKLRSSYQIK